MQFNIGDIVLIRYNRIFSPGNNSGTLDIRVVAVAVEEEFTCIGKSGWGWRNLENIRFVGGRKALKEIIKAGYLKKYPCGYWSDTRSLSHTDCFYQCLKRLQVVKFKSNQYVFLNHP